MAKSGFLFCHCMNSFLDSHFSDKGNAEVDIVLRHGARCLAGVKVKAAATVTSADFQGLRKLKKASGAQFSSGVVLYDGENTVAFGDDMFAVPVRSLWEEAAHIDSAA